MELRRIKLDYAFQIESLFSLLKIKNTIFWHHPKIDRLVDKLENINVAIQKAVEDGLYEQAIQFHRKEEKTFNHLLELIQKTVGSSLLKIEIDFLKREIRIEKGA